MASVDLDREAASVRADGARIQGEGWLSETTSPEHVAAFVAATERVDGLSTGEVVDIVRQGLDVDLAESNGGAVRELARDVLLKRAQV
jgi:hypothetical protein